MRILTLTSSYPKFPGDGTAPFIERIVLATAKLGHEIDVVLPRHPELRLEGRDRGLPVRFHPFVCGFGRQHRWGYASSMEADRRLRKESLALVPVVALASLAVLVRTGREAGTDLLHAHWALPNGAIAAVAARILGVPLVVSLHGSDVFVAEGARLLGGAARQVFQSSAWITACSSDLAARARNLGAATDRLEVIPYGVDPEEFAYGDSAGWRARVNAAPGDFLVVGLGRLVAKKGFVHLVRAAAELRGRGIPVRIALGGVGDLEEELRQQARHAGLDGSIVLLGNIPHSEVGGLLRAADVVAVPSVRDERGNVDGLPNVLLEGLAAGRPVVASRIAGIPDVLRDGENGLLVPPGDPGALAAALERLSTHQDLADRLGRSAAETARTLSWENYGRRLVEGYERVLGGP